MAYAHAARYADEWQDRTGAAVRHRAVTVYEADGTTPAVIWADSGRNVPLINPTTTGPLGNVEFFADPGEYVLVCNGQPFHVTIDEDPRDARLPLPEQLVEWAEGRAYAMTTIVYHSSYPRAVATASVQWPDGSAGTVTGTLFNAAFGTTDAYTVTHTASGLTVTQPPVTRNAGGEVTIKPPLVVA